ncbi:magnesium-translocating P-type ATPase [Candidatus Phytoplasma phoenicium]|uniref:Magnesium-transporting ATPase, P-type 1 n=1 Tax=Candidatus Phytoplasma phoenicium TaxID=198422 RepID=A0A2S8NVB3_9MOLU|nr:magnesium-translocating P-type ATPase [Candidatus Phytoplasma phoenicium]
MKKRLNKNSFHNIISLKEISPLNIDETLKILETHNEGLTLEEIERKREIYGENIFEQKKNYLLSKLINILLNPFNILLLFLAFCSLFENIFSSKKEKDYNTSIIIFIILIISNLMHFIQEARFSKVSEKLRKIVQTCIQVKRNNHKNRIIVNDLVVGDIVYLSAGDIIPADIKLLHTKDFFVKETALTGESIPIEKKSSCTKCYSNILEDLRIVFMGTNVVSGYAKGVVVATGNYTYLGKINKIVISKKPISNLKKTTNKIVKLISLCIATLFPLILILNWLKNNNFKGFIQAFTFALTIVVGITPEMLPLIITTFFLMGVNNLAKKKVIIKNLYSIQDFGTMNLLFTDKTGTLTDSHIKIQNYLDLNNKKNEKIIKYAFFNSFFQTGLTSSIDIAIIEEIKKIKNIDKLTKDLKKIDEIPFDFKRRIVSVVVLKLSNQSKKIISKGAVEEILKICNKVQIIEPNTFKSKILPLDKTKILNQTKYYNKKGFRVIGIAYKEVFSSETKENSNDILEKDMTFIGFITFYDKPKASAMDIIQSLKKYNIKVKMLTGDDAILSQNIAKQIQLDNPNEFLLGKDIEKMNDNVLYQKVLNINILAKLNPEQKCRIVSLFRAKGHIVGFMGDGINDAPAMQAANLAISVNSGVDIAKESADVILLEKNLKVLQDGIIEGRKMSVNTLKYIKFTLSANFGNILSIVLASLCLKFIPLLPIQILFLNLIYDIICLSLGLDNVENTYLKKPRTWDLKNIIHFTFLFGFVAFIFDIFFCLGLQILYTKSITSIMLEDLKDISFVQTSWFIFSIWSQILTIYHLRMENLRKNYKIHWVMFLLFLSGGFIATILPCISYTQKTFSFVNPFEKKWYMILLIFTLIIYSFCLTIAKKIFIKKYKELI